MLKLIGNLFRKSGIIDKSIELIDKSKFTEQEQASLKAELIKSNFTENTQRIVIRGKIATTTTMAFLFSYLTAFLTEYLDPALSDKMFDNIENTRMGEAFMLIIGFYFLDLSARFGGGSKDTKK